MDKNFSGSLSFTHAHSVHDYYVGACAFFEWKITREHTDFRRISSPPRHTSYYSVRRTFLFIFSVCRFHGPSILIPSPVGGFVRGTTALSYSHRARMNVCIARFELDKIEPENGAVVQRSQTLTTTPHTFVTLPSSIIYASDFNDPKRCIIEITIKKKNI